ncbi:DNA replication protein [Thiorhodovibrio winogradskyi]|uniref:DNA replication protein n=1 Tax=Thiorhodovibrio winogradskyi TaxID=77007 RepID=A0ABZ0S4D4_9GAMM|nr:ATP-binding protein [Thiorhodovibrio winogradskyi]
MMDAVLRQLRRWSDVFGTDLYVHYSAAYVWQANQFGHSFIGLFLALVGANLSGKPIATLGVLSALYAVKELLDYAMAVRLSNPLFPANRAQVAADGLVDWSFVTLGAALGALSQAGNPGSASLPVILAAAALLGFFLLVRQPYLRQKRAFDRSGLPYFSRLANYPLERLAGQSGTDPCLSQILLAFLRQAPQAMQQLIITGAPGSGRTSLASAIGGEATAAETRVRYLTGARLLGKSAAPCEPRAAPEQPWSLREADLVIIDELAPLLRDVEGRSQIEPVLARLFGESRADEPSSPLSRPNCDQPDQASRSLAQMRLVWVIDDPLLAELFCTKLRQRFADLRLDMIALGAVGAAGEPAPLHEGQ